VRRGIRSIPCCASPSTLALSASNLVINYSQFTIMANILLEILIFGGSYDFLKYCFPSKREQLREQWRLFSPTLVVVRLLTNVLGLLFLAIIVFLMVCVLIAVINNLR
jgi:hypothetical protein